MPKKRKPKNYWTLARCRKEAAKYEFRSDFHQLSSSAYQAAIKNGWLDEICGHMLGQENTNPRGHWTFERCREEAAKHTSRTAFRYACQTAYRAALRKGWLDDICGHMQHKNSRWTLELCRDEAAKYRMRKQFHKNSRSAYDAASRNGWLDDVCAHMQRKRKVREGGSYSKALPLGLNVI